MIDELFGSLFGVGLGSPQGAAQRAAAHANAEQAYLLARAHAAQSGLPTHTLPAGIFWERAGPREHWVTIRRHPEVVVDYGALANAWMRTFA